MAGPDEAPAPGAAKGAPLLIEMLPAEASPPTTMLPGLPWTVTEGLLGWGDTVTGPEGAWGAWGEDEADAPATAGAEADAAADPEAALAASVLLGGTKWLTMAQTSAPTGTKATTTCAHLGSALLPESALRGFMTLLPEGFRTGCSARQSVGGRLEGRKGLALSLGP